MRALVLAMVTVLTAFGAKAADEPVFADTKQPTLTPQSVTRSIFSEFRVGGFAHNVDGSFEPVGLDLNAEVLFAKPFTSTDPWIDALLPRPHVGGTLSFTGQTSMAYAGLTWQFNLTESLFAEGTFGAALNNGLAGPSINVPPNRLPIGCNLLYRESASLGYNISPNWSVMGTVEHSSNAGGCISNQGITNAGLRFGYKF
jgi:lipid A 3-O-deacylase